MLTPLGLVFALLSVAFLLARGKKALIDPVLIMLLQHLYFFGFDERFDLRNDYHLVVVLVCSMLFFLSHIFARVCLLNGRIFPSQVLGDAWTRSVEKKFINFPEKFFQLLVVFFIYNYFSYLYLYDFEFLRMFLRMYANPVELTGSVDRFLVVSNGVLIKLFIGGLFLARYFELTCGRKGLSSAAVILLWLILIPYGTRGNVILSIISFFLGDLVYSIRYSAPLRIGHKLFYAALGILIFFLLSIFRNVDFAAEGISADLLAPSIEQRLDRYSGRTMNDHVYMALEDYGDRLEYMGAYTFWGILSNPIPRSVWGEKPIGIGKVLAINDGGSMDDNVSYAAGYMGEGWVAFGLPGSLFFSLLFGFLTGVFSVFALKFIFSSDPRYMFLGGLFLNASILFVRGDMLSAWVQGVYPIFLMLFFIVFGRGVRQLFVRRRSCYVKS